MKKPLTLTGIASIGTILVLMSASEATAASGSEISRKEALLAQSGFKVVTTGGSQQAAAQTGGQPGQQLIQGQSLYPTMETAGPNHIEVQQFGGFGPMGTAALGDW